jgi:hypothetical protein
MADRVCPQMDRVSRNNVLEIIADIISVQDSLFAKRSFIGSYAL